jgi:hypothetical protein
MSGKNPFLVLRKECDEAVCWLSERLNQAGLQVVQTFDRQVARAAHGSCSCPHHGTEQCDCQMVVLLVYENANQPASLVAHGRDGQTWFSLVDSPQQRVEARFEALILDILAPHIFALKLEGLAYAG